MAPPLRVLNLDDNDAARYARSKGLMNAGFEVLEAATGGEALEISEAGPLDVAVLDVKLPDMSGLEVTRRMRANPMTRAVRIVQVSAVYLEDHHEQDCLEQGADIYLRAPIEPEALSVVVSTLARLRKSEAALLRNAIPYGVAIHGSTIGIAHLDLAGYFNQVNHRFCEITGRSPQEACRMTLADLFHADDGAIAAAMFYEMTRGDGRDFRTELRLATGGAELWADCSFSLVRSASGVVREAVVAMVDVSARKICKSPAGN
jgi:PAS domain S-box-containing protein